MTRSNPGDLQHDGLWSGDRHGTLAASSQGESRDSLLAPDPLLSITHGGRNLRPDVRPGLEAPGQREKCRSSGSLRLMRRLLLDFGGVVIRTPFEMRHRVGNPPWLGPFAPHADPLWRAQLRGDLTEREYWQARAEELFTGADDPVRALMDILFAPPAEEVVRPETLALVDHVEDVAVLTNDLSRFHDDGWLTEMNLDGVFEPLIDLSYTDHLKPDPVAFQHALTVLSVPPGEVVFVDDQRHSSETAARLGLNAVWFDVTDPASSTARVLDLLG